MDLIGDDGAKALVCSAKSKAITADVENFIVIDFVFCFLGNLISFLVLIYDSVVLDWIGLARQMYLLAFDLIEMNEEIV